ncbi:hypothetical protein M6B38_215035 [Iris pallida]|uniref:Secreted protein n=1 Tax=Iris pallida TaxID=29817 RepID=A0AAX6E1T6_IRIPA|nr:hypothetical protein M6B38_215035 [Iris pallida]
MAIRMRMMVLLSFPYLALYVFFLDKLHIVAWSWTTCRQGGFSNGIPGPWNPVRPRGNQCRSSGSAEVVARYTGLAVGLATCTGKGAVYL